MIGGKKGFQHNPQFPSPTSPTTPIEAASVPVLSLQLIPCFVGISTRPDRFRLETRRNRSNLLTPGADGARWGGRVGARVGSGQIKAFGAQRWGTVRGRRVRTRGCPKTPDPVGRGGWRPKIVSTSSSSLRRRSFVGFSNISPRSRRLVFHCGAVGQRPNRRVGTPVSVSLFHR